MRARWIVLAVTIALVAGMAAPGGAQPVRLLSLVTGGTAGVYFPLAGC